MKVIDTSKSNEADNLFIWQGPFMSEKSALEKAKRSPGSVVIYEPETSRTYAYWYVCKSYPKGTKDPRLNTTMVAEAS